MRKARGASAAPRDGWIARDGAQIRMFGTFAIAAAALFAGAALYIGFVEQPARLELDDHSALAEWRASYPRGLLMQASLAIVGPAFGLLEWIVTGNWLWGLGAVLLLANWPYTVSVIMPVNKQLEAAWNGDVGPQPRELLQRWGRLHSVRTALGFASLATFLWATI